MEEESAVPAESALPEALDALVTLGSKMSPVSLGAFTVLDALGALGVFGGADGCAASGSSKVGSVIGKTVSEEGVERRLWGGSASAGEVK